MKLQALPGLEFNIGLFQIVLTVAVEIMAHEFWTGLNKQKWTELCCPLTIYLLDTSLYILEIISI